MRLIKINCQFDKDKLSNLIGKQVSPEDFSVRKGKDNESLICLDGKVN